MAPDPDPTWADTAGVAGFAFGVVGVLLCWVYPFGVVAGGVGVALGVAGRFGAGQRGWQAAIGPVLSVAGTGAGLLMAHAAWVGTRVW